MNVDIAERLKAYIGMGFFQSDWKNFTSILQGGVVRELVEVKSLVENFRILAKNRVSCP